jgi:sugar phosphate isomerase/epimerase
MRAGIGSYAFRYAIGHLSLKPDERMSFQDLIVFCAENEVEALQVCENIPLHLLTDEQLSDGFAMLEKHSITFEAGTVGFAPAHLATYAEIANSFGAKILRTVLNAKDITIDDIAVQLKSVVSSLEKTGVTLAIENHFDLTPFELRALVEKAGHPLVKICIDPLNSITLLHGINETFDQLKNHIVSAHVKDVKMERKGSGFHIYGCPLGEGISQANSYLANVYSANPESNVFIEQWMDACHTTEDTLSEEKKWVTDGAKFLKNKINQLSNSDNESN